MNHAIWKTTVAALCLLAAGPAIVEAQQTTADIILTNGKIITVDDRFTIAQAVAVRGDRIVAVGTNEEIARLAGPDTRRIDLAGRSVVPGLIDNHAHYMEEGVLWTDELRLDGIETRKQAIEMMRAKAAIAAARASGSTRSAAGRPISSPTTSGRSRATSSTASRRTTRCCCSSRAAETYVNSRAIEAIGLEKRTEPWIKRDASGTSDRRRRRRPAGRGCESSDRASRADAKERRAPTTWR